MSCCSWTYKEKYSTGSCNNSCGTGKARITYRLYSKYNEKNCGFDYDYETCKDDSGCYEPDPTPNPNPGGSGGGSSCTPTTINGNRCDTTNDILYYISTCCGGKCNYSAKAGKVESGTVSQSLLQGASKCSSYGPGGGSSGGGSSGSGSCETTSSSNCWYLTYGHCVGVEGYNCELKRNGCYCSDH